MSQAEMDAEIPDRGSLRDRIEEREDITIEMYWNRFIPFHPFISANNNSQRRINESTMILPDASRDFFQGIGVEFFPLLPSWVVPEYYTGVLPNNMKPPRYYAVFWDLSNVQHRVYIDHIFTQISTTIPPCTMCYINPHQSGPAQVPIVSRDVSTSVPEFRSRINHHLGNYRNMGLRNTLQECLVPEEFAEVFI